MRARQLEVFNAVMREGTITAAAQMLNISQPALSQVLLRMEDELGFSLFERVKGRLNPTPEALELLPETERLIAGLQGMRRKCDDLKLGRTGLVRVASSTPPGMAILPRALAEFRARHPDIMMRSHIAPIASIIHMLREGECALALALDDRLPPDINADVVGFTHFVCLLPEGHSLAARSEIALSDLESESLISYRAGTRPAEELSIAERAQAVNLTPILEIDASISAVGFVQAGLGIAIVDGLLPWHQFAGLTARPLAQSPALPLSLLVSRGRRLSRIEEIMRDHLRLSCAESLADGEART